MKVIDINNLIASTDQHKFIELNFSFHLNYFYRNVVLDIEIKTQKNKTKWEFRFFFLIKSFSMILYWNCWIIQNNAFPSSFRNAKNIFLHCYELLMKVIVTRVYYCLFERVTNAITFHHHIANTNMITVHFFPIVN